MIDRDTERILSEADAARRRGDPVAMATIVGVDGSAYRREGARMLIRADDMHGVLSAGCLEDDAVRVGREVLETGEPRLLVYDSRGEDDALWGWGSGCRGLIHVLVQIPDAEVLGALVGELSAGRAAVIATVVAGRRSDGTSRFDRLLGAHAVRLASGEIIGSDSAAAALAPVFERADNGTAPAFFVVTRKGHAEPIAAFPETVPEEAAYVVLAEPLAPPPRVLIIGAGADAVPLSVVVAEAGFRTLVVDHRSTAAVSERFPHADDVLAAAPDRMPGGYITPNTYVVVMTHQFEWDSRWLAILADSPAPYIGLIGPRERTERLFEHLEEETGGPDAARRLRPRLYNPVGLDLGGRGPGPIAVAVAAEILAVLHERVPRHLRDSGR